VPTLRALFEALLEDDSFPRAGAVLAANPALLTADADDVMAGLLAREEAPGEQPGDGDRAAMIRQFRAFAGRCRTTGLAAVFPPGHAVIDPTVVACVSADMAAADDAEQDYDRTSDIGRLTAAAAAWQRVMTHPALASAYPALRAALLNNGGGVLLRLYWAAGRPGDLDTALGALRTAATPTTLANLALVLSERYLGTGDPGDLTRAIECAERACLDTEPGDPHVMLGDLLRMRYEATGQRADLARAVALLQAGLDATPAGDPERHRRLVDLGVALLDRHDATGDPRDLAAVVRLFDEAARVVPAASPDRAGCLVHQAIARYRRYQAAGSLDDLDRAADWLDEAVRATGAGHADAAAWSVNLAAVLHERARRTGASQDRDRAIALLETVCAPGSPARPYRHAAMNDLGNALRDRYHVTGARSDLDGAVRVLRAALSTLPAGSALSATLRANLGAAERDKYAAGQSLTDLDEAIGHLAAAVTMSSAGDPDRARRLFGLALATRDRYELRHQEADLDAAVEAYRHGCAAGLTADPLSVLAASQEWGAWAVDRRSWPEAATAFRAATDAMLAAVRAQLTREHKENWLRDTRGLPGRAAYAAAMARQLPAAVAAAEAGRAAILAEALHGGEPDLRRLAGDRPDLARRYTRAAGRLRSVRDRRLLAPGR
jgi:hypothetical protein